MQSVSFWPKIGENLDLLLLLLLFWFFFKNIFWWVSINSAHFAILLKKFAKFSYQKYEKKTQRPRVFLL
jgi:hypothetical protein